MVEVRWPHIRFVDCDRAENQPGIPRSHFTVDCGPNERIVNVETVKDAFGYVTTRVWIVADPPKSEGAEG